MNKVLAAFIPASFIVASATASLSAPVITEYNGFSVKLRGGSFAERERSEALDAEALRICKAGGKQTSEFASTQDLGDYVLEHLYLCLE